MKVKPTEERQRLLLSMWVVTTSLSLTEGCVVKGDISHSRAEGYLERVINIFVNIVLIKASYVENHFGTFLRFHFTLLTTYQH